MYTSVRVYVLYCTYVIIYMSLTNCTGLAYIENLSLNDTKYPYRRVVGQLMYGMVHTIIDIMYALNVL